MHRGPLTWLNTGDSREIQCMHAYMQLEEKQYSPYVAWVNEDHVKILYSMCKLRRTEQGKRKKHVRGSGHVTYSPPRFRTADCFRGRARVTEGTPEGVTATRIKLK